MRYNKGVCAISLRVCTILQGVFTSRTLSVIVVTIYDNLVGATSLANDNDFVKSKKILVGVNLVGRRNNFGGRQ